MNCPKCGEHIPDGAFACPACGEALVQSEELLAQKRPDGEAPDEASAEITEIPIAGAAASDDGDAVGLPCDADVQVSEAAGLAGEAASEDKPSEKADAGQAGLEEDGKFHLGGKTFGFPGEAKKASQDDAGRSSSGKSGFTSNYSYTDGKLEISKPILDFKKLVIIGVAIVAVICIVIFAVTSGSGGSGLIGGGQTQSDSRYADRDFKEPTATEPTDGTILNAPEGYVPAYTSELDGNEVHEYKVGETFTVGNTEYTVYAPSNVHASDSIAGLDSFLVDIETKTQEGSDDGEPVIASGTSMFYFSPNGLYTNDLCEQARQEELMLKINEYESRNEEVPQELYNQIYEAEDQGQNGIRTVELPYQGDGTYTIEVRDFVNKQLYRVALDIKL